MTVVVAIVISGHEDQPIGRPVTVVVDGKEHGSGVIVSRYRFPESPQEEAAYVYEGTAIDRSDLVRGIIMKGS